MNDINVLSFKKYTQCRHNDDKNSMYMQVEINIDLNFSFGLYSRKICRMGIASRSYSDSEHFFEYLRGYDKI